MPDKRDELLEEIERLLGESDEDNDDCECACYHIDGGVRNLIERARTNGVIRYPRP